MVALAEFVHEDIEEEEIWLLFFRVLIKGTIHHLFHDSAPPYFTEAGITHWAERKTDVEDAEPHMLTLAYWMMLMLRYIWFLFLSRMTIGPFWLLMRLVQAPHYQTWQLFSEKDPPKK